MAGSKRFWAGTHGYTPGMPAHADDRLKDLVALAATRRANLPLRFLRQTAHFTTPLSDPVVARKAVDTTGPRPSARRSSDSGWRPATWPTGWAFGGSAARPSC